MRTVFISILVSISLAGCAKHFSSTSVGNIPPKTYVSVFPFRDSVQSANFNPQSSQLQIHWWANDPDGIVAGYVITFDRKHWTFTTKNDSVFALPLFTKDTTYIFSAAAIDNSFKGTLNEGDVVSFTDANGNGVWDKGEIFPTLGSSVDPDPPSIKFPIANTPPLVEFVMNGDPFVTRIDIPETTFTVVSFGWRGSDIDGNSTITNYYIALNDTLSPQSWVELPSQFNFVTLKARLSEAFTDTSTISCDIYPNTYPAMSQSPLPAPLRNMKLNGSNIFYIKARDVADQYSPAMREPDTTKTWFVKKPKGNFLVVNDYGIPDQSTRFYTGILDTIAGGVIHGKFDLWDIKGGSYYPRKGSLVQPYVNPTFQETLKLYKYVFWYASDEQDFDIAQTAVREFRRSGGKIFMTFMVPASYASGLDVNQELRDFSDAIDSLTSTILMDSLSISPITSTGFVKSGTRMVPFDSTVYPVLVRDSYLSNPTDGGKVVGNLRGIYPSVGASVIYRTQPYGVDNRQPVIGVMSGDNTAFIIGVPLYRFNGNSTTASNNTKAYQLIYKVLKTFGVY